MEIEFKKEFTDIANTSEEIGQIHAGIKESQKPDTLTEETRFDFEDQKKRAEINRMHAETHEIKSFTNLRNQFAISIFIAANVWVIAIFRFIWDQSQTYPVLRLSDQVIVAVVHMGTYAIIGGMLVTLVKHLFNRQHDHKRSN